MNSNYRHGHATGGVSSTYRSWYGAKTRCFNENHQQWMDYGGRGITMCERWASNFANFLADMGERPETKTLDRIDGNGDYEPGNCRWETQAKQNQNSRRAVLTPYGAKRITRTGWQHVSAKDSCVHRSKRIDREQGRARY